MLYTSAGGLILACTFLESAAASSLFFVTLYNIRQPSSSPHFFAFRLMLTACMIWVLLTLSACFRLTQLFLFFSFFQRARAHPWPSLLSSSPPPSAAFAAAAASRTLHSFHSRLVTLPNEPNNSPQQDDLATNACDVTQICATDKQTNKVAFKWTFTDKQHTQLIPLPCS
jgi:hypothetical protein